MTILTYTDEILNSEDIYNTKIPEIVAENTANKIYRTNCPNKSSVLLNTFFLFSEKLIRAEQALATYVA